VSTVGGEKDTIFLSPQTVDQRNRLRYAGGMNTTIPSAADIAAQLAPLRNSQVQRLAELSGVPFHTLLKIKTGETGNPRIDTVCQFAPFIAKAKAA